MVFAGVCFYLIFMGFYKFSTFFGEEPIFNIPVRTFPVLLFFSKTVASDFVDKTVQIALKINCQANQGDILIFMTGQEDFDAT